jgi:hypothetical protein
VGQGNKLVWIDDGVKVEVVPVNDQVIATTPDAPMTQEDVPVQLYGWNVSDPDFQFAKDSWKELYVSVSTGSGALALNGTNGLNGDLDGSDGSLTFTGHPDQINYALNGLTFSPKPDFAGVARIHLEVNDQGNVGDTGPTIARTHTDVTVNGVPEQDELGKPESYYESELPTGSSGAEGSSGYQETNLQNFVQALYLNGFVPFYIKESIPGSDISSVGQLGNLQVEFETLVYEAIFNREIYESQTAVSNAWDNLMGFVSSMEEQLAGSQWIGLEDFLNKLRAWQFEQTDLPGLDFNAYTIKLWEWLESTIDLNPDLSKESMGASCMVFDLEALCLEDILCQNVYENWPVSPAKNLSELNDSDCQLFDPGSISFWDILSG